MKVHQLIKALQRMPPNAQVRCHVHTPGDTETGPFDNLRVVAAEEGIGYSVCVIGDWEDSDVLNWLQRESMTRHLVSDTLQAEYSGDLVRGRFKLHPQTVIQVPTTVPSKMVFEQVEYMAMPPSEPTSDDLERERRGVPR